MYRNNIEILEFLKKLSNHHEKTSSYEHECILNIKSDINMQAEDLPAKYQNLRDGMNSVIKIKGNEDLLEFRELLEDLKLTEEKVCFLFDDKSAEDIGM